MVVVLLKGDLSRESECSRSLVGLRVSEVGVYVDSAKGRSIGVLQLAIRRALHGSATIELCRGILDGQILRCTAAPIRVNDRQYASLCVCVVYLCNTLEVKQVVYVDTDHELALLRELEGKPKM